MAGKLQRVEAFNNVSVRTVTDIVTGDRGVYVPDTDIAHIGGHVRITRGANQVNGSEAVVNMKTGIATLLAGNSGRVTGLIVPNDQSVPPPPADTANKPPQTKPSPARPGAEGKQ
jgi:lipopolysaccharide export system protein LptA